MVKIVRTLVANRRDVNDSFKWAARGDKLRTIWQDALHERSNNGTYIIDLLTSVLELPLSEFCNKYVSCQ
jgi:hypothetical protein